MRHDPIRYDLAQSATHEMRCTCHRCKYVAQRPLIEPEDIQAIQRGLIGGGGIAAVILLTHYWPTFAGWITS